MFSDRIQRRKQLWWRNPGGSQTLVDDLRRLAMLHARVGREAPQGRWRRGQYWQRRLLNKLNSREFVAALGCAVPELYWHGRFLTRAILSSLPDNFVLKPALGRARRGVYVMVDSVELLTGRRMTRNQLWDEMVRSRGRLSHIPLLAEEFVVTEQGEYRLPIEHKFYMFGGALGAIQAIHRSADVNTPSLHRFYTAGWQPFEDRMQTKLGLAEITEPPACLPQMIDVAVKLGGAFDTFVRVDLYAGPSGCVFGEFSSAPYNGLRFTAYANDLFETLWQQNCPDRI